MLTIEISELMAEDALLVEEAQNATALSYSPYSHFSVGAAILLENGKIIKGANQENASYPVGICAERATLATAQNLYPGVPVIAIALAAKDAEGHFVGQPVTPCGMCRQAIAECEKRYNRAIRIIMSSKDKVLIANEINDLLPAAFT